LLFCLSVSESGLVQRCRQSVCLLFCLSVSDSGLVLRCCQSVCLLFCLSVSLFVCRQKAKKRDFLKN